MQARTGTWSVRENEAITRETREPPRRRLSRLEALKIPWRSGQIQRRQSSGFAYSQSLFSAIANNRILHRGRHRA